MANPNQGAGEAARAGAADRRDSVRIPIDLLVRELALGGSFEQRPGNLGLGGVRFE